MKSPAEIIGSLKRKPTDVVGLDIGSTSVHAVRMRKNGDTLTVAAIDILELPPSDRDDDTAAPTLLHLPSAIKARYASLTVETSQIGRAHV